MSTLPFGVWVLFDFDPLYFFLCGQVLFGEAHFQDTVVVGGIDIARLHVVYAKAAGVGTVIALPADILVFVFLVLFLLVGSGDREQVIFQVDVDIGLVEARQLGLQQVLVALIDHVGLESVEGGKLVAAPEAAESIVEHPVKGIIEECWFVVTVVKQ